MSPLAALGTLQNSACKPVFESCPNSTFQKATVPNLVVMLTSRFSEDFLFPTGVSDSFWSLPKCWANHAWRCEKLPMVEDTAQGGQGRKSQCTDGCLGSSTEPETVDPTSYLCLYLQLPSTSAFHCWPPSGTVTQCQFAKLHFKLCTLQHLLCLGQLSYL